LDTLGGLITFASPQDLPEGSSPRCWDVDFIVGSVFTRPGLAPVYSYAELIFISQVTVGSGGLGTFTYTGNRMPIVNESFVLTGFILQASFLNGQTVIVLSSTPTTFTAYVTGPAGIYINQSGTGTSTEGIFVGPNPPNTATDINSAGNPWNNPPGILGDTSYASTTLGLMSLNLNATSVTTTGWSNPSGVLTNTFPPASINHNIVNVLSVFGNFPQLPATLTGLTVSYFSHGTVAGESAEAILNISLANGVTNNGYTFSTDVTNSSAQPYTAGSPEFLWGFATAAELLAYVSAPNFNVQLSAQQTGNASLVSMDVNVLVVTLYYTQTTSDMLYGQDFEFTLNPNTGITGIQATFQAYALENDRGTQSLIVQLLKNGVPVGTPKTQALTTIPTVYLLGSNLDEWGYPWLYSDINSLSFGVSFTATTSQPPQELVGSSVVVSTSTVYVNDVDLVVYITPGLDNFNYIKTYIENNQQINTLALDASGNIWVENVTSNPGVLSLGLTGIIPGSFAQSATADGNEYIMFSNLQVGTDRPRLVIPNQETGALMYEPVSQVGPGAPPSFQTTINTSTPTLTVTSYTTVGDVITFTFTTVGVVPAVGSLYIITGTGNPALDGHTFTVLGTPEPTLTTFSSASTAGASGGAATATPTLTYSVASITQPGVNGVPAIGPPGTDAIEFNGQTAQWSVGANSTAIGPVMTLWYGVAGQAEDAGIVAAGNGAYIYIGASTAFPGLVGTWVLINHGITTETGGGTTGGNANLYPYIQVTYLSSGSQVVLHNDGNFQLVLATLTLNSAAPDLESGDTIQINGVTPTAWNGNWTIVDALTTTVVSISSTQALAGGVAQFTYSITSVPPVALVAGEEITITNTFNFNGVLNTTGVISPIGLTGTTFQVAGFAEFTAAQIALGNQPEDPALAQGVTFGTQFTFNPAATDANGANVDTVYGSAGPGGTITIIGGSLVPIGPGTRQAVCFFITESGFYSPVSPFVVFTTTADGNFITASNIPIGPPNTIARAIAFTEAGQNGVPGANFYIIPEDVIITVGNTTTKYTSTIIHDNVTSKASFTFTDAILLDSEEIDIQGADQFNLIELGSSAWVVPYKQRNFYGMQLNKVTEFDNLSFDGGYLSNNPQGQPTFDVVLLGGPALNLQPLGYPLGVPPVGWNVGNLNDQTLVESPVTGLALYIKNTYAVGTTPFVGMIWQTAFQDQYQVAIIEPNISYSVRVACSNPSGIASGNLLIDLVSWSTGTGFTNGFTTILAPYGEFSVPVASMTTNVQVFTGELLAAPFTTSVPSTLVLRVCLQNTTLNTDVLIDRIEVFPTLNPYLLPQVYGSYADNPEAIDASDSGGIIDTTSENPQTCYGGFVMHDSLFLLKQSSMYQVEENPQSEPGGWSLKEVSNKVGAVGIHAYDTGEEWALVACRDGIFGFAGGQPTKLTLEIFNLWDAIYWASAHTIVLRNDISNKRFYCWIPLPTGTSPEGVPTATVQWLPEASYNPTPTSPNVCLMCNYQGLDTAQELFQSPGVRNTMMGVLAAADMRRKWTIWQIPSPYADFITQQDGVDKPLYIANGIASSKIYQLETSQLSDDGTAINSDYCCYGFVNSTKAATIPIFGLHRKLYTVFQVTAEGAGIMNVSFLPNTITPKYPYSIPGGISLSSPSFDDYMRPLNVQGNRMFVEFSTDAVGSWMHVDKLLLTGRSNPWSSIAPTGGGNAGVSST
jgi:hypothetical protein